LLTTLLNTSKESPQVVRARSKGGQEGGADARSRLAGCEGPEIGPRSGGQRRSGKTGIAGRRGVTWSFGGVRRYLRKKEKGSFGGGLVSPDVSSGLCGERRVSLAASKGALLCAVFGAMGHAEGGAEATGGLGSSSLLPQAEFLFPPSHHINSRVSCKGGVPRQ